MERPGHEHFGVDPAVRGLCSNGPETLVWVSTNTRARVYHRIQDCEALVAGQGMAAPHGDERVDGREAGERTRPRSNQTRATASRRSASAVGTSISRQHYVFAPLLHPDQDENIEVIELEQLSANIITLVREQARR